MRAMNLPTLPIKAQSADDCVGAYLRRLPDDETPWPHVSLLLTAYMTWPNDELRRNSLVATYLARFIEMSGRNSPEDQPATKIPKSQDWQKFEEFGGLHAVAKPAFQRLTDEIGQSQRKWLLVADIFHKIIDMAYDDRILLGGGPSISKAIEVCEVEYTMPGRSQLRNAWSEFRDVGHLIAASAYLAHTALAKTPGHAASILKALWIAPDAVIAIACGFQEFWLQHDSGKKARQTIQRDNLWQIPTGLMSEKPFIVFRRLTEEQIEYLRTRRAAKKYEPTTTPHRVRK
jgi:hypothetical protein